MLDLGLGRRHHRAARPRASAPRCSRSTSPATSWPPATGAPREEGLANLRFEEGDASHLDCVDDESFDLVVTIFGAMFAPNPVDVAKEMVRVTRPGGRIVMGNWIPGDPTLVAQLLKISAAYSPPPPEGFVSPVTWGVEENVIERFSHAGVHAAPHHVRARHLHVHVAPRRRPTLGRASSATTTGRR